VAAGRDKIVEAAAPLLSPGESIAHVVKALEGPNRWIAVTAGIVIGLGLSIVTGIPILAVFVFLLVFTRLYARRVIVATDRAVHLLAGGRWGFTPRLLLQSVDVETAIGPLRGLWLRTDAFAGRRLYVTKASVGEVRNADADLADP
jgi:hypothetical protein